MPGVAKVVLVTEHLRRRVPGGIGTYVRSLLRALDHIDTGDITVVPWSSRAPVGLRSRLWDIGVGRVGGDVVHAPSLAFPPTDGRLVVMIHDLAWRDAPETFPRRGRQWHERAFQRAVRQAHHFVVPSSSIAGRAVAAGIGSERVTIIEEGCDHLPPPDHDGAAKVVRGEFILTVGTREPRKNLSRLAAAYRDARARLPEPWPLVVVGPKGWGEDAALEGVIVTGAIDDAVLAALYQRARAFAYVPLLEGFGLPPVEAMFAGAPVVTSTAVPSSAGAALEVDPRDVGAIGDAIVAAATDDATRAALVRRGRARAAQLTWRRAAELHLELWESLR